MGELREECGIVAVYHLPNRPASPLCPTQGPGEITRLIPRMLLDVQNRGQLSAGASSYNPDRKQPLTTYKESGSVAEAFHQSHKDQFVKIMDSLVGCAGIGQVRYSTVGQEDVSYAHPFERPHIKMNKWFTFCFNAQLANYEALKQGLIERDANSCFSRDSDSEIFMHYLCAAIKEYAKRFRIKSRSSGSKGMDYVFEVSVKDASRLTEKLNALPEVERFSLIEYDSQDIL